MKETTGNLLQNAEETLSAANILVREGFVRDAASRAYYAIFYIAEALLNEKGLNFKKHGAVHGAFAQHYVKTGLMDAKYHKLLTRSFSQRMLGDYDEVVRFGPDEVTEIINQARDFLRAAKEFLQR